MSGLLPSIELTAGSQSVKDVLDFSAKKNFLSLNILWYHSIFSTLTHHSGDVLGLDLATYLWKSGVKASVVLPTQPKSSIAYRLTLAFSEALNRLKQDVNLTFDNLIFTGRYALAFVKFSLTSGFNLG
jgi:hypothetical protein